MNAGGLLHGMYFITPGSNKVYRCAETRQTGYNELTVLAHDEYDNIDYQVFKGTDQLVYSFDLSAVRGVKNYLVEAMKARRGYRKSTQRRRRINHNKGGDLGDYPAGVNDDYIDRWS